MERADELSLFYPAARAEPGVVPSVRLKAYRRGQQDVEYLTLWVAPCGLPRWAVGQQVREALHLAGSRQATETGGAEDAGRIDYSRLRPQDLWALRVRIGEALSQAHPRPLSRLVELRTPPRVVVRFRRWNRGYGIAMAGTRWKAEIGFGRDRASLPSWG